MKVADLHPTGIFSLGYFTPGFVLKEKLHYCACHYGIIKQSKQLYHLHDIQNLGAY